MSSDEFKSLDPHTQGHLRKPTVPIFEIATASDTLGRNEQMIDGYFSTHRHFMLGITTLSQQIAISQRCRLS